MSGSAAYLPLSELVAVLGDVDAVKLVAALGGTRVYVPAQFRSTSPVVAAIGAAAADRLSKHIVTGHGGLWVDLPRGPSGLFADYRAKLAELASRDDLSEPEIARTLRVHGRTVRRMRAKLRREEGQERLL